MIVKEARVLIVAYELLAILGTVESSDCLSPYPIHERSITSCPDLLYVIFGDLVSFYWVLGHEDVPCASTIFTVSVTYLVEFFVVGVGLIGGKPACRGNQHGKL